MASIAYLLKVRNEADRRGDRGLYRAMSADLERLGYTDHDLGPEAFETAVPEPLEKAVPGPRGGRPKLPRCEHGKIVGRCLDCDAEDDGPVAA
jgi:hypothetical protein